MKNKLLAFLAVLFTVGFLAVSIQNFGISGGLIALSAMTTLFSFFAGESDLIGINGKMFAAIGIVRPLVRGESNLSGILHILIYTESQFPANTNWPTRGKGEITGTIPYSASETAARWTFDIGTGKGDFVSSGPITNKTYKHSIEGKVSGIFQEQLDSLDDLYNKGCIVVAVYPNGKRKVYGSTRAPLFLVETGTTATKPEDDGKGITLKFESIVGCDFPPRQLASTVTITEATIGAYPTQVSGVTP